MIRKLMTSLLCLAAMTSQAQGTTLQQQEEEDSTIAVIGFFCKNDTMEYTHVTGKEKIVNGDTTLVSEITERMMVVVTDSTSDGYKMELIPLSCETQGHSGNLTDRLPQLVWERTKNLRCKFTTDELGTVQHIENWREIRDVLKSTYKMVFDSLYASLSPGADSVMPRQNLESLVMLGCSTEDGIKEIYDELEMLFGLHGKELAVGRNETDDVTEAGYPSHTMMDVFFSAQNDEYDCEGDYVVQGRTVTTLSPEDADDLLSSTLGLLVGGEMKDSVDKYTREIFTNNGAGITVTNTEQYCYFYNGWPKLMQKIVDYNMGGKAERVEYEMIEWRSRHWGVFTFPDEEDDKKNM